MIKSFSEFFESISGTELIGPIGPNYGPINLPHKPKSKDTDVVYSEVFGKMVTQDQYQELYQEYLKKGSKPLHGFNLQNLEIVLSKINESNSYRNTLDNIKEIVTELFQDLSDDGIEISYRINQWGKLLDQDSIEFSWQGHWKRLKLSEESYSLISKMVDVSKICNDVSFDENGNIPNLMKTNKYILLKRYFDRMEQELNTKIKNIVYYQDPYSEHDWISGSVVIFISKINI